MAGKAGRSGAKPGSGKGNLNGLKNGSQLVPRRLTVGELPPQLLSVRREGRAYRRCLEVAVLHAKGEVSVLDSHLIDTASAATIQAGICRWVLRNKFGGMSPNDMVLTGDPRTVRGFSVIAAVVDEICFFGFSEESKVRSDTELIRSLRPALANTRGRLLSIGTPYAAKGYGYETFKRAFGSDSCDVLCWSGPSLLMNPKLPRSVVDRALAEDPVAAVCEYVTEIGRFREDVDNYIGRAAVEALVVPGRKELPPLNGLTYSAFADVSGGRHDDAALAIGHREDRTIILDCLERYKAPHNPYEIVAQMVATLRRYGCDRAIGDAYAAEWTRVAFASHGVKYNRASTSVWKEGTEAKNKIAKPKSILYGELLPRLHAGEVELLDNDILISQLASLQRRTRSGARDSIDHPPGGHDDLANAVAGVCDACSQRVMRAGMYTRASSLSPHGEKESPRTALAAAQAKTARESELFEREQRAASATTDDTGERLREAMNQTFGPGARRPR